MTKRARLPDCGVASRCRLFAQEGLSIRISDLVVVLVSVRFLATP